MKKPKVEKNDVDNAVTATLKKHPEVIRKIPAGTDLHRKQPSKYDSSPVNYKADSDTRYADPDQKIGVFYVGLSPEVAIAESFQSGQGVDNQAVPFSALQHGSLHLLSAARDLRVVDVAQLANLATGQKLRDLVQAKGQGREGYAATRNLSGACMRADEEIDGLLYPSAVYTVTGDLSGCNLVLFAGRGTQVEAVSYQPVLETVLANGQTTLQFLNDLGVTLE